MSEIDKSLEELKNDAFNCLSEVVVKSFEKAIKTENFSDLIKTNLVENVVDLADGRRLSYNEAFQFLENVTPDKNEQEKYITALCERLDDYLSDTLDRCDNDNDKILIMYKILNYVQKFNECLKDDISKILFINIGSALGKFGSQFEQMQEKLGGDLSKKFENIRNKEANLMVSNMSAGEIVEDLVQNNAPQIEMFTQQLDFIIRNAEPITRLTITDAVGEESPDLDNLSKRQYKEQLLIDENFEDLSLMVQKWQKVSKKIESLQVDEGFKKKLKNSLNMWKNNVVSIGGEYIKQYFDDNEILSDVPNRGEKAIEFISKISVYTDSLVDKSRVKDVLGSSYLEKFIPDIEIREFCNRNYNFMANEKAEKIKNFVDRIKTKNEQKEQDIQLTP